MPELISRGDALAAGLKFYCTGEKCKNGHRSARYVSGWNCVECGQKVKTERQKALATAWRSRNPERLAEYKERYAGRYDDRQANYNASARNSRYLSKYGETASEIDQRIADAGHRCEICATDKPGGMGYWHVDHDHDPSDGRIRGILCSRCNLALGLLRDSIPVLQSTIRYLERHWAKEKWAA